MRKVIPLSLVLVTILAARPGLVQGRDTAPPGKPVLTFDAIGHPVVVVNWNAPGDKLFVAGTHCASYDLRYRVGDFDPNDFSQWDGAVQVTGEPSPPDNAGTPQSVTLTLGENQAYTFILKCTGSAGTTSLSDPATLFMDSRPPGKVLGLQAVGSSPSSLNFTWLPSGDDGYTGTADHYTFHYSTSLYAAGQEAALIADPATQHLPVLPPEVATFALAGLNSGTLFCVTVTASDENGNSGGPADLVISTTAPYIGGDDGGGMNSLGGGCGVPATAALHAQRFAVFFAAFALMCFTRSTEMSTEPKGGMM